MKQSCEFNAAVAPAGDDLVSALRDPADARLLKASADLDAWLAAQALPLWSSNGLSPDGGFAESLTSDLKDSRAPRRCRVQARQVYVFATTGPQGLHAGWSETVCDGLDYLFRRLRRPDGLYVTCIDADGHWLDETPYIYDQAFVLLALAAASSAGIVGLRSMALDLLGAMEARKLPAGGFRESGPRPWQANAHMHLLEAALAWHELAPSGAWRDLAASILELCETHFVHEGVVVEYFDAEWRPLGSPHDLEFEPGHQFEWSWLLGRSAKLLQRPGLEDLAFRLYEAGCRGVMPAGYVADVGLASGANLGGSARLWPQTERLKAAAMRSMNSDGPSAELEHAVQAYDRMAMYLRASGDWHDRWAAGRFAVENAPASSLYHIVSAANQLRETALGRLSAGANN